MGLARYAGKLLFGKGKTAGKMASAGNVAANATEAAATVATAGKAANAAGEIAQAGNVLTKVGEAFDNPALNYGMNTAMDAGFGMLWGESPGQAIGRAAVGNLGATAFQAGSGKVLDKMGVSGAGRSVLENMVINPLGYTATEMAAAKIAPGFYGMGDSGQAANQTTAVQQMLPGLSLNDRIALQEAHAQQQGQTLTPEQRKTAMYSDLLAEFGQSAQGSSFPRSKIDPTSTINMVY